MGKPIFYGLAAVGFLILTVIGRVDEKLYLYPLVSTAILILSTLALLPVVRLIADLNAEKVDIIAKNSRFSGYTLLVLLILGPLMVFGVISDYHRENYAVVSSNFLSADERSLLKDELSFSDDETIDYIYSPGISGVDEIGVVMTSKRLLSYSIDNDTLTLDGAKFENISSYSVVNEGGYFQDKGVKINLKNGGSFMIYLSIEGRFHKKMLRALTMRIKGT